MNHSALDIVKYCVCMEEVKARITLLDSVIAGSISFGRSDFETELFAVHFRKILELIVFSSMVANKGQYSNAHKNFASHWNAKEMLDHLESINPEFYPSPMKVASISVDGVKNLQFLQYGFLTKKQFISLYNRCGGALHTKNPYSSKLSSSLDKSDAKKWISHIQKLLWFHRARMFGESEGWIVVMQHETDDQVHAFPFHALPSQP